MLYYGFKNYEEFKSLFGEVRNKAQKDKRRNRIILAFLKSKEVLHYAVKNGYCKFLHIDNMAELEERVRIRIFQNMTEMNLPYQVQLNNYIYYSSVYETDGYYGVCEDGDYRCIRYYNHERGKIFKMKAGKFYRNLILGTEFGRILPEQVVNYLCEVFVQKWHSYSLSKCPEHTLHVDDDFERIYSSEFHKGDFHSCMTNKDFHDFYKNAVDASTAYLEDSEGKIIARCIIFNEVKDEDGKTWRLAERQYSSDSDDILKHLLVNALINGGYIDGYKKVGAGCSEADNFVDIDGNSLSGKTFYIDCNLDYGDTVSYQDSFKYYDINESKAYNKNFLDEAILLDTTEGRIENLSEYDDYHDYQCEETVVVHVDGVLYHCDVENLGEFRWVSSLHEYHHCKNVFMCDICCDWELDVNGWYSFLTEKAYCCKSCYDYAEREYKEDNWYYSEYDMEYYEDEDDIAFFMQWNPIKCIYERTSISVNSLNRLIDSCKVMESDGEYYNVNPETDLPYHYELIKTA